MGGLDIGPWRGSFHGWEAALRLLFPWTGDRVLARKRMLARNPFWNIQTIKLEIAKTILTRSVHVRSKGRSFLASHRGASASV